MPAAPSSSVPAAPERCRARSATAGAGPSRRSPTPTWSPAGSRPTPSFPGIGRLDVAGAAAALDAAGLTADGVLAVVDAAMVQALRAVSVERGVDPRGLALVAFGGAGPLHACTLADALGMPAVIVPARAGVLSAVGILTADEQRHLVRTWPTPRDHTGLDEARALLAAEARALLDGADGRPGLAPDVEVELEVTTMVDCRYAGQSHELTVPDVAAFAGEHQRRNGYARADAAVEVIAVRAVARRRLAGQPRTTSPRPARAPAVGPAVVAEADCTIWVPAGWRAVPGHAGALVLRREP